MKIIKLSLLLSFLVLFFSCGTDSGGNKGLTSIQAIVAYGNPPPQGGQCTGCGICNHVDINGNLAHGVLTTFTYDSNNPSKIKLSFLLSKVQAADIQEYDSLTKIIASLPTATPIKYKFTKAYPLSDVVFKPLGLKPTATIKPNVEEVLTCKGDSVEIIMDITQ